MTLAKRKISVALIDVAAQKAGAVDRIDLSEHRVEMIIENPGGVHAWGKLDMRIFGMSQELMNRFEVLGGRQIALSNNEIAVDVGDDATGRTRAYQGNIFFAYQDMRGAPDISLNVSAVSGLFAKATPAAPHGFNGSVDVASAIQSIAISVKMAFRNNGVKVKLQDHYLSGSPVDQIRDLARAADIMCSIDNGVVSIWPRGASSGSLIVDIGPQNGMVGYPAFTSTGLLVTTIFNPSITLGCDVKITSSIPKANGIWNVATLRHELASMVPGGPWYTTLTLTLKGLYAGN